MAIIHIKDGIDYDTEKSFINQTQVFQDYANELYYQEVKEIYDNTETHYPDFDKEGNINYIFEDNKLNYRFKRVQNIPFSTSNRSCKLEYIITVK